MGFPKRVLLKYYDKEDVINVEFNFHSNRNDMSFNYYISQPKSMLETMLIIKLDKYPEKLKILEYYGFGVITHDNRLVFCIRNDWLNNTPTEPNNNSKKILRNR